MSYEIRPLAPEHAAAAAAIHAEGQENTFLTSLGGAFLRALYAEMASSPHCFGFIALDGNEVIGVVTGTVDSGAVFKDLMLRQGARLALLVAAAMLRRPSLVPKVLRTAMYPAQTKGEPGEAELFFIGTRRDRRGEGAGRALFGALAAEMRRRGMTTMGLTVDEANHVAKRFYQRNGMRPARSLKLYGRPMQWYVLPLQDQGDGDDRATH
jgi:ribosomal protein S18 acetylase RimI-like enzyme